MAPAVPRTEGAAGRHRRRRSGSRMRLLRRGPPDDGLHLLTGNGIGAQIDHVVHADAVGLEDLQDLHQRTGLAAEVVAPVVLGDGERRGHQAVDQRATLPIDLVLLGDRIHQHHQLAVGEVAQPGHAGDDAVLGVERCDTRSLDVQLQLHQWLVVDPGARFAHAGDAEPAPARRSVRGPASWPPTSRRNWRWPRRSARRRR